jgi:hypothetical protein
MVGLFPVRHQVDKIMKKACPCMRVLHDGQPTRAHLLAPWRASQSNIKAVILSLTNRPGCDDNSPMVRLDTLGRASTEDFDVPHAECRPGERLVDMHADSMIHHLNFIEGDMALSKAERDRLAMWVNTKLNPLIREIENNSACALRFTDGSQTELDG